MTARVRITEYLDIDLDEGTWCCNRCGRTLITAQENYKKGCVVRERDPREIYNPVTEDGIFAPDPKLSAIVEFYCPGCATMVENEALLLGHPITHDIQLDVEKLRERHAGNVGRDQ